MAPTILCLSALVFVLLVICDQSDALSCCTGRSYWTGCQNNCNCGSQARCTGNYHHWSGPGGGLCGWAWEDHYECRGSCKCSTCPSGQYVTTQPSAFGDRKCSSCPSNTYSTSSNVNSCTSQPYCSYGERYVDGGKTAKSSCGSCPTHQYMHFNLHRKSSCYSQPTCGSGSSYPTNPPKTKYRTCTSCPIAKYQDSTSHRTTSCKACPSGKTTLLAGAYRQEQCVSPTLRTVPTSHRIFLLPDTNSATRYQYNCVELTVEFFERNLGELTYLEIYTDKQQGNRKSSVYSLCDAPNKESEEQVWNQFKITFKDATKYAAISAFPGQQFLIKAEVINPVVTDVATRIAEMKVNTICSCVDHVPGSTSNQIATKLNVAFYDNTHNGQYSYLAQSRVFKKNGENIYLKEGPNHRWGFTTSATSDNFVGGLSEVTMLQFAQNIAWKLRDGSIKYISVKIDTDGSNTDPCMIDDERRGQLDCVSKSQVHKLQYVNTETSGRPGTFKLVQHLGKVFFRWDDFSICESAFALSRDQLPFTKDVVATGALFCGERYEYLEEVFDDLTAPIGEDIRPIGTRHEYCVQAVSDVGVGEKGYSSDAACADFELRFESLMSGVILTSNGFVPVGNVDISWKILAQNSSEEVMSGETKTFDDGTFEIHIIDDGASQVIGNVDVVAVHVTVSKGSGKLAHNFKCQGSEALCGGYDSTTGDMLPPATFIFPAKHFQLGLGFNSLHTIYDASAVPFSGKVFFPMTAQVLAPRVTTGALPDWAPDAVTSCPLLEAVVCLHDYDKQESSIGCTTTDRDGHYKLAASVNMRITVSVQYGDHNDFVRAGKANVCRPSQKCDAPDDVPATWLERTGVSVDDAMDTADASSADAVQEEVVKQVEVFQVKQDSVFENMNLFDQTHKVLQLDVHGTHCKFPIGKEAVFTITSADLPCDKEDLELVISTESSTMSRVVLPSHHLKITLEDLSPSFPQVTDDSEFGYFKRVLSRTRRINLDEEPETEEPDAAGVESSIEEGNFEAPSIQGGDSAGLMDSTQSTDSTSLEHSMVFRYHPEPTLKLDFIDDKSGEVIAPSECSYAQATDAELAKSSGYEPMSLRGKDVPGWAIAKGTVLQSEVRVTEQIPYPSQEEPEVCDWIENAAVQHVSKLGLSDADMLELSRDKTTIE